MRNSGSKGTITQKQVLINFLQPRFESIIKNPNLIVTDRWTPSDVWYGSRPELLENGIKIGKNTRKNFTAMIRSVCEELFNCNMEELGIFAADRAQLYFDGHWHDVGFDELDSLAIMGTDLIIIEKEGMAEVLTPYADKLGIALLFTRGFATKYVRDLAEISKKDGCNLVILSDYDASGILLASKLDIPRIGVSPATLRYFNLERRKVEEGYDPGKHLDKIYNMVSEKEFDYLRKKRIEINSIKTKVGNDALWNWIIHELHELFPYRNYKRSINIAKAKDVLPEDLNTFYNKIETKIQSYIDPESDKIISELSWVSGFIHDVPAKRLELKERLRKIVAEKPEFHDFVCQLNRLVNLSNL